MSGIPLFLGIEPYGCTEEEFLRGLENLDLLALDAVCCGKILFDDGFGLRSKETTKKLKINIVWIQKIQLKLS